LVAACSEPEPAPTATSRPVATATPVPASPTPEATATPVLGSGIKGGDPEFDFSTMVSQGYWLSRDDFGPFVMASGMGVTFQPPMDAMQMAMQMIAQNPDDPVMVPQNLMPLQAVFKSGSAHLVNDPREFDPMDFEGLRLDPDTFDKTVSVRGQAETMLKETQWAHNFGSTHFGKPDGDFGAQQRFIGMMVSMLAKMQGQYAMQNLMGDDGLFHDSDGNLDYTANWVMLHALSDIAGLTGDAGGRYMDPDAHPMFEGAATALMGALDDRVPASPQEAAAAIRALAYRASTAADSGLRDSAVARAGAIADSTLVGLSSDDVVDRASAIAGLIAAAEISDDDSYRDAAEILFTSLSADFDPEHGVFESRSVYSSDQVAWIIGGLNSLAQKAGDQVKFPAKDVLLAFYESSVANSGLQLSAPPGKNGAMAGEWEKNLPGVIYYHPVNTPSPPMAMALTVPAEEITWDGESWSVTSDRFVPAGAMHLANELNWLGPHLGSIPFPEVSR
jgi:hypothetical protein